MCPASMADCGMASLRQKASRPGNLVNGLTEGPRGLVVFLTAPVVSLSENKFEIQKKRAIKPISVFFKEPIHTDILFEGLSDTTKNYQLSNNSLYKIS